MQAIVYEGPEMLNLRQVKIPQPAEGEVLIKVAYAGICGSDLLIYHGGHGGAKPPVIIGHEFTGIVEEINGITNSFKVGDRVVIEPLLSCNNCEACRTGNYHVCQTLRLLGIHTDGGFAEYVTAPIHRVFKLSDGVSLDTGAIIEPLAVACHVVRRSKFQVGDKVVILGAGPIGYLLTQVLKVAGAGSIIVSEPNEWRRQQIGKLGVLTIDPSICNPVNEVYKLTEGTGADVVYEVAGVAITSAQAVFMAKIRGQVVFVGLGSKPMSLDLKSVSFKELSLIGSRVYNFRDYEAAINLIESGKIDSEGFVTHILPLTEVERGIKLMEGGGETLKVLITVDKK